MARLDMLSLHPRMRRGMQISRISGVNGEIGSAMLTATLMPDELRRHRDGLRVPDVGHRLPPAEQLPSDQERFVGIGS